MSKKIPKTGPSNPASSNESQPIVPLPSKIGCDTCIMNMNTEDYNYALINESLSSKKKIANYDKLLYRYERIQIDAILNEILKLKRLKQIEVDKIEQAKIARDLKSENEPKSVADQNKVTEKITFNGGKGAFVKKIAHDFFNINNPIGLHLSETYIELIAIMLCANFKASNGKFLDLRQTRIGLKLGLNMDQKGEVVLK